MKNDDKFPIQRYFTYDHLPEVPMRLVSAWCTDLAIDMAEYLPVSDEAYMGLRKLLEAKDCFVRAAMDLPEKVGEGMPTSSGHLPYLTEPPL